jgi:hypothetical protein
MIIRSEQLATLDEAMQKRYHEELQRLLREQFPQLVHRLDDRTLLDRIATGVQKAQSYRVCTDEGILGYVGLSLAAGPAFNNDAKIRHFLELPGDPDSKIRWLFNRVVEKLQCVVKDERSVIPTAGTR